MAESCYECLRLTEIYLQRMARLRRTNEILSLWSLSSASLYTPLQLPAQLGDRKGRAGAGLSARFDTDSQYHAGALYAAHIDTTTVGMR